MSQRWFLQSQAKFVLCWTLWAAAVGMAWVLFDRAANGGHFTPEGVGIGLVLPVSALVSGPIMWRLFLLPRLRDEVSIKRARED